MKKIVPFSVLVLGLVIVGIFISKRANEPVHSETSAERTEAYAKVIPTSKEWRSDDEAMLEKWAEQSEQQRSDLEGGIPFEATLADGETLVTEVQELEPGVFLFTQLTPEQTSDGHVMIKAQTLAVDLDGETSMLTAPSILLKDGSAGTITVASESSFYGIEVSVQRTRGGTNLSGQVKAEGR